MIFDVNVNILCNIYYIHMIMKQFYLESMEQDRKSNVEKKEIRSSGAEVAKRQIDSRLFLLSEENMNIHALQVSMQDLIGAAKDEVSIREKKDNWVKDFSINGYSMYSSKQYEFQAYWKTSKIEYKWNENIWINGLESVFDKYSNRFIVDIDWYKFAFNIAWSNASEMNWSIEKMMDFVFNVHRLISERKNFKWSWWKLSVDSRWNSLERVQYDQSWKKIKSKKNTRNPPSMEYVWKVQDNKLWYWNKEERSWTSIGVNLDWEISTSTKTYDAYQTYEIDYDQYTEKELKEGIDMEKEDFLLSEIVKLVNAY